MDPKDIVVGQCDKMWGIRCPNSHGYKYKKQCSNLEVIAFVEEMWPKVYQKKFITNNEINLAFAKGIVAQWKGYKGDWAKFATKVQFQGGETHKVAQNYYFKSKKMIRCFFEKGAKLKDRSLSKGTTRRDIDQCNNIVMGFDFGKEK